MLVGAVALIHGRLLICVSRKMMEYGLTVGVGRRRYRREGARKMGRAGRGRVGLW